MRKRLAGCVVGGVLGLFLTSTVNDSLGLPPAVAMGACSAAGIVLGYVVTTFADVFSRKTEV